jgi:hypothetical protein
MLAFASAQNGFLAHVLSMPVSQYSGFVPNSAFFKFSPACVIVYAVAQHLSFHQHQVTPAAILKIAPRLSERTINNSLTTLTKECVIKKESYGNYLFHNPISDKMMPSNEITNSNFGYYIKIHHIKDEWLSNKEILGLAIIENLTHQKKRTLSIDYIAKIMQSSRSTATRTINGLEKKGYLSRARLNDHSPYLYRVEKPKGNRMNLSTPSPQNDTPKTPQNDAHINNSLNIYNKEHWLYEETEAAYEIQKNESLKSLEGVLSALTSETEQLDRSKRRIDSDIKRLNEDYTAACKARDLEKMASVRSSLAKAEIALREAEDGILNKQLNMQDWQAALKVERGIPIRQEDITRIGTVVKKVLPDFSNSMTKKMAFCLLFNSIIKDLRFEYYEKLKGYRWDVKEKERLAMTNAISVCLFRLTKPTYRLNRAIYNDKTASVVEIAPKPSNERYRWPD